VQVFDVVREQITRALQYQMTQLDQFRNKLGHLSYQDITNLWQAERTAKEKDEMLATPIQYVNMCSHWCDSATLELVLFRKLGSGSYLPWAGFSINVICGLKTSLLYDFALKFRQGWKS